MNSAAGTYKTRHARMFSSTVGGLLRPTQAWWYKSQNDFLYGEKSSAVFRKSKSA
jgi:hypothetical protein